MEQEKQTPAKGQQSTYYCYRTGCEWEGNNPSFEGSFFALCPRCGCEVAVMVDLDAIGKEKRKAHANHNRSV